MHQHKRVPHRSLLLSTLGQPVAAPHFQDAFMIEVYAFSQQHMDSIHMGILEELANFVSLCVVLSSCQKEEISIILKRPLARANSN